MVDTCLQIVGDLEHLLLHCQALQVARDNLFQMWLSRAAILPELLGLVIRVILSPTVSKMTFILDPLSIPELANLCKIHGNFILWD